MRLETCSCSSCWQMLLRVVRMLPPAPMANGRVTSSSTGGSAAVPTPVVTAATTASTSSLDSHTRAAGSPPCSRLKTASDSVNHGLASHTRPSTRRNPCQVVLALAQMARGVRLGPSDDGGGGPSGAAVPLVLSVRPTRAAAAEPSFRPRRPPPGPWYMIMFIAAYLDLPRPLGEAARSAGEGGVVATDVRARTQPSPRPSPRGGERGRSWPLAGGEPVQFAGWL